MPADKLLAVLLRSFQTVHSPPETARLFSTSAALLTTLHNPLNISLLTSQILTAKALWEHPDGLRVCLRVLGIFQSASIAILENEEPASVPRARGSTPLPSSAQPVGQQAPLASPLDRMEWVRAVVKGANERTLRWKHLLPIGGVLLGFEGQERNGLPKALRSDLEGALVMAINMALEENARPDGLDSHCIALVLNHTFSLLPDWRRRDINYEKLLPRLMETAYFSVEGYQSGYFLAPIDADIVPAQGSQFTWSDKSTTFFLLQRLASRPLISSMGPLSKLIAYSVESARDPSLLNQVVDNLVSFSRNLLTQWRQNKLSEIDVSEESMFLDAQAMKFTIPILWQVLKSAMFASVVILRAVMGRVLADGMLAADGNAPYLATKVLHVLRNLYFISSRLGPNAFSTYTFVSLTAIDILFNYPSHAETFLREIRPREMGHVPKHPLERCLDLYFLNTAEHFTLVLSPQTNEELLVAAVSPYVAGGGHRNLLEIFEAAHSVMLAVMSAPQNAELTAKVIPFHVDALFKTFPANLSSRQFRLAFRTLIRVSTPPTPLSETQPDLASVLLELLHHRALHAPTSPLEEPTSNTNASVPETPISEQAAVTLTLLDTLPFLPVPTLEEWLEPAAELVAVVQGEDMKRVVRERFWEVLSSGEMDVERAGVSVAWWGTRGGREKVLFGDSGISGDKGRYTMSGGLGNGNVRSQL